MYLFRKLELLTGERVEILSGLLWSSLKTFILYLITYTLLTVYYLLVIVPVKGGETGSQS